MHYLDANASEPIRPEARAAMLDVTEITGNPSSVHGSGRAARRVLEDARELLASRFGARPQDLIFTSGGTEADVMAIHALGTGRPVIVSATEHDAVLSATPGATRLPVDRDGVTDLTMLEQLLARHPQALVCLMLANNETGTIQPVAAAAALCRRHGALLHVDAVQAAGRIGVQLAALGAHSLAISSHKLGGPPGAGALLLTPELTAITPLIVGGGQELGRRGGTPALPAIAGFAAAARAASGRSELLALRDAVERTAVAHGAIVCGAGAPRLDNTTCIVLPGIRADAQVIALDLDGIAVSAGAACSSGKVATSHVLAAMGLGPLAGQAIRVSLPWNATREDVTAFSQAYPRIADRLRGALAPAAA